MSLPVDEKANRVLKAELEAAEARCTAMTAERDAMAERGDRWCQTASELDQELADLRGSITRLIAQWREMAIRIPHSECAEAQRGTFESCANYLEAALTPRGETT